MLTSQTALCETGSQGRDRGSLAELRRALARPSALGDGQRRHLLDLAQRLARVQALGGEYARVGFSPKVHSVIARHRISA